MSTLKSLCTELDEDIFTYFDTLNQVFQKQNELNELLKDGFLLMAKARYSMGAKGVSSVQYNLEDMTARIKVDQDVDEAQNPILTASDSECEKPETADADGLRKRNVNDEKSDESEKSAVEDVPVEKKSPKKDPIRWFGVLVPQALRDSQARFRRAAELSCELAMLKVRCDAQRVGFRTKLENKESLIKSFSNMSFSG